MTNVSGTRAMCCSVLIAACLLLAAEPVRAQNPPPGPITIAVDATDAPRRVFHAKLQFPVSPAR